MWRVARRSVFLKVAKKFSANYNDKTLTLKVDKSLNESKDLNLFYHLDAFSKPWSGNHARCSTPSGYDKKVDLFTRLPLASSSSCFSVTFRSFFPNFFCDMKCQLASDNICRRRRPRYRLYICFYVASFLRFHPMVARWL